jgi:putative phage-type endonuclease
MPLTAEQHEARAKGLGGSDIAAALGVSPWKTPFDLYREKLGLVERPDLSANDAVHFGNVLEDVVAQEFTRRTGVKVRRNNQHLVHPKHDFLLANIDRQVVGKVMGVKAGLECKTADKWAARDKWGEGAQVRLRDDGEIEVDTFDDQVPDWYLLQCAHYMAVTGSELWFLAVLIGGNDFRIFTIHRDDELENMLLYGAGQFWHQHVLAEVPPPPSTQLDLETMFAQDNGNSIDATPEILETWAELKEAQAQMKYLETRIDGQRMGSTRVGGLKNQLRAFMGYSSELLLGAEGKPIATWKKSKDSKRFDEAALKAEYPELHKRFQATRPGPRVLLIK